MENETKNKEQNTDSSNEKLLLSDVIKSVCECGSAKFNITVKDKPFCFLCGKDARQTVL